MGAAGGFVAFLLVATPLLDYLTNITPWLPGNVDWRYGVVGLLSGFLLTPLLGMVLASLLAVLVNRRGPRMIVGWLDVAGGAALLLLVPLFLLDFLQIRAGVPPAEMPTFQLAGVKAMLKHITAGLAFLWLGYATLRGLPPKGRRGPRAVSTERAPILPPDAG